MRDYAENGAAEGTVLIAREQTKGRGRLGKSFFSPRGTGLYMSILLKPDISPEGSLEVTTAAAVALARVIMRYTKGEVKIKWVNDIYVDLKKVCGILTEASVAKGTLNYAVLGIGVNLFAPRGGFPSDIKNIASSVSDSFYSSEIFAKFTSEVIDEFFTLYKLIGRGVIIDEYREYSLICGREITVIKNGDTRTASALYIADDYSLAVEYENGDRELLSSGDVSIKL